MISLRIFPRLLAGLFFLSLFVIAGCGGTSAPPAIAVSVSPATATLIGGASQTFTATVTNDSANAGVTWTASTGTITSAGVYTAPAVITATSATVTATSKTDTTKTGTATVTLTPIGVSVSPTTTTLIGGASQTFTATVTADGASAGVTWAVTAGTGTITATGVYTAPAVITTTSATVTATSKTDTTKSANATITLTPISVSVAPPTATLAAGATQTFTATVTADGANAGVTWTASVGSITAGGVYTAPTPVATASATITATSKTDPTKTGTATVTLTPISVSVAPPTVTLIGGATQTFTATVTGDGTLNQGVTWTVSAGTGTITSGGVYTAPAVITTTSATVTATSKTDPTKTGTATVTLTPIAISFTTVTTGVTLDSGQTMALAASVTNDGSASGATFAASGAGSVAPTSATGNTPSTTLTATGTTASAVTVTATSIKDTTKSATTASITVNPALAITTPAGALTAGTTNTAYAGATIATSGGTGTKTFALASGALPGGLTLSAAGAISGTVTGGAATYTFTVTVTDTATTPVSVTSGTYTITITATPLVWTSPTISPAAYTVGTAITPITLVASGGTGTITYSLNSGTLPAGLTLSGGVLSGTPTAPTAVAGVPITFKATDSATPTPATVTSPTITLVVNPVTLAITTTSLPMGYQGVVYNTSGYQMTSTGGTAPITWTMSPTTADGLTMSTGGLLSGTPTGTYSSNVTITATDSATNQQQSKNVSLLLTVTNALSITNNATLPNGTVGNAYTLTLNAAGGSGTGYTFSITSGQASLTALGISLSSSGNFSGTPSATGSASFTVKVTDSASNTASVTFSLTVVGPLALPTPSATVPGSATTGQSYTSSISASGGTPGYTFTLNGSTTVANNGTLYSIGDGLNVSSSSSAGILSITGTPTTSQTVTFTLLVTDSQSHTASNTYSIVVSTNSTVNGQLNLVNNCGTVTLPGITVTLSQGATTVQTVTANGSGAFSFANVANGTYTVTPSYTATGASFISYPASQSITVSAGAPPSPTFSVALGYTVSGTVAYSGTKTGQIYLGLSNNNCGGSGEPGTSISAPGTFSIRGVAPGTYTLQASMDTLGKGVNNTVDPTGSTGSVTVSTASLTGTTLTLSNPGTTTLPSGPSLKGVIGFNSGALAQFGAITNSSGVEMATSYTLQWSTSSSFTTIAGSMTFPATGANGTNVWVVNSSSTGCTSCNTLTNGSTYYFRAYGTSAGTAVSSYGTYASGGNPVAVTIGAPTGGVAVSGTVTFSQTATGPLYVGFYNTNTNIFYGEYIPSPSSPQAYTVNVPTGSGYYFIGIIDQNNDGAVDPGDITDTNNLKTTVSITGATTGEDLTLPTTGSTAVVQTQDYESISSTGTNQSFSLNLQLSEVVKLPVAVTLQANSPLLSDGANVLGPMDIASCSISNCGGQSFQVQVQLAGVTPTTGDTYTFNVTYSDGTTGTTTGTVTGVLTSAAFATNLLPNCTSGCTSTSTTPTFTWTYPSNPTNYTYQFSLCCSSNSNIWQIPGNNSNSNGFTSSQIPMPAGIPWSTTTDPLGTNDGNGASIPNLSTTTNYTWQITTTDSNNNQATVQVNYQP